MALSPVLSVSPFSLQCNYSVKSFPFAPRPPGVLSPWEQSVYNLVRETGAVAFSQVCFKSKHKHKLKSLARCGLFAYHRLEGKYKLNILTPGEFPGVLPVLKSLCFTRLVLLLRQEFPVEIWTSPPSQPVLYLNNNLYNIIIHRETEPVLPAVLAANQFERSIVLAENYYPEFKSLERARILLDNQNKFLLPDGSFE